LLILFFISSSTFSQPSDYIIARAFDCSNQIDSAINYYSKIIEKQPGDVKIYLARGKDFYLKKLYPEAIDDYTKANSLNAEIADFSLAQCYAQQNNINQSIQFLKKHLSSKYKLSQSTVRLDPAFNRCEESPEWKELWANDWYDKYDSQIGEARFMFNNKDWMGVVNFVNGAVKDDTKHHELIYFRAKAYYELENYNTAVNEFTKAIELHHRSFEYYAGRADANIKLGNKKNAIKDYSEAIELAPDVFSLYLKRARTNLSLGDYDKAKDDASFYLALFKNDSTALNISGQIAFSTGKYFDALVFYNKLIKEFPKISRFYISRGETFEKTGMQPNALKDYNYCLMLEPKNFMAMRKRGQILLNREDKKNACADFLKAMKGGDFEANNLYLDNCR
jgi:tetratricopeptide (TPR) repeat protein